jgi:hypothetical protein
MDRGRLRRDSWGDGRPLFAPMNSFFFQTVPPEVISIKYTRSIFQLMPSSIIFLIVV